MKRTGLIRQISGTLRGKLTALVLIAMVPLLLVSIYLIRALVSYSNAYDEIVSNMTIANSYNLNIKEELDESIYKLVVQGIPFRKISYEAYLEGEGREESGNPYLILHELHGDFDTLVQITTDRDSANWLNTLLRNIDTLEGRVDDIRDNLDAGGHYNENIEMLDKNIYILTELIQDDIQYYIYYQTRSIEQLKNSLKDRVRSFLVVAVTGLILLVSIVIAVMVISLHSITRPLNELTRVTERISGGDFNARAGIRTHDEIGQVSRSVNDMAQHLQVMVEQIKEDERKMRHTELRLLQEQINPHFLYNTLDTIIWLIEGDHEEDAVDMVVSLSDFFKLALSRGKEFIIIRDEELHISSYLKIQQMRYRDILEYEIAIDPQLYHYRILKLTLQPLVENALYHGIKYKRALGHVRIAGHMTPAHQIELTVEDDGVGMDEAELTRLREEINRPCGESEQGFGMANVNERIRMNFGKEYGLSVDSEKGAGTRVTLLLHAEWIRPQTQEERHEA